MNYVYVAGASDGPVKIGFTNNPRLRLTQLRTASPSKVDMLVCFQVESGHEWLESAVHADLRTSRLNGEWFSVTQDVAVAAIKRVAAGGNVPVSETIGTRVPAREGAANPRQSKYKDVVLLPRVSSAAFDKTAYQREYMRKKRQAERGMKIEVKLRGDLVAKFKATGPGWQARMNDALAAATPPQTAG